MKKILLATILLVATQTSFAQIKKAELMATGLTCSMCSNAINKAIKAMPEVEKVETNLNTNTFTILLKKGNTVTANALKEKVEKAGFFVGSLIITVPFADAAIADNEVVKTANSSYTFIDTKAQTIAGDKKIKVLDKGFVTTKEYKKLTKTYAKYPSFVENKAGNYNVKLM